jgi:hypothetical protein
MSIDRWQEIDMKKKTISGLLLAGMLVACAGEEDIDRTQANRLPKAMFQGTWYIRNTVIGVPGTSAASFIGMTGELDKIRWEIQEEYLIAYRAYEEIPGTDSAKKGASDPKSYKENPIAVLPIKGHFDIKREYNASTGEQYNVIVENTSDRPWHQRDYLRVDWAASKLNPQSFGGVSSTPTSAVYFVQAHDKGPDAMRVEDKAGKRIDFEQLATLTGSAPSEWGKRVSYFDLVGRYLLEPEKVDYDGEKIPLCYFISYNGANYQTASCGPTEVKVRTAFLKADDRNFEPVELPNPEMGKFGYFRTERFTWDRKYGFTEKGRIYLANVHNIWEQAYETAADGSYKLDDKGKKIAIPLAQRKAKPIVYHLSENFPCELIGTAREIAGSWNTAFRRTVAVAKGLLKSTKGEGDKELASLSTAEVPREMFKLDLNGWVQKTPSETDWSCANLVRDESKAVFRLGDLRYNTMAWIHDRQITGPLGYGPSSADPETGEIISGVAHVYGAAPTSTPAARSRSCACSTTTSA